MIRFVFTTTMLCTIGFLFGQTTIIEHKQSTENGVTKGWKITKEYDQDGNLIRYDSTSTNGSNMDYPNLDFYLEFDGFGERFDSELFPPGFADTAFFNNNFFHFSVPPDMGEGYRFFWGDTLISPEEFEGQVFNFEELMKRHQEMMDQFFRDMDYDKLYEEQNPPKQAPKKEEGERI